MHEIIDFLRGLYNAERLLEYVRALLASPIGFLGLFAIVFSETGLLVGFFIPGDSILFTIGVASGAAGINVFGLGFMLMCAAIIGDNVGYYLGYKAGPHIFNRPKSRFFHPDHLVRTREFYDKHGPKAIVYSRFIPIVRTCTPFLSGVVRMAWRRFLAWSLLSGSLWIVFMTTLGYRLGQIELVRRNFEKVVLVIVFLSLTPVFLEAWKARRRAAAAAS